MDVAEMNDAPDIGAHPWQEPVFADCLESGAKGEADHAPSPLHQEPKCSNHKRENSSGLERSDRNKSPPGFPDGLKLRLGVGVIVSVVAGPALL
jgi:hypothetical protein